MVVPVHIEHMNPSFLWLSHAVGLIAWRTKTIVNARILVAYYNHRYFIIHHIYHNNIIFLGDSSSLSYGLYAGICVIILTIGFLISAWYACRRSSPLLHYEKSLCPQI